MPKLSTTEIYHVHAKITMFSIAEHEIMKESFFSLRSKKALAIILYLFVAAFPSNNIRDILLEHLQQQQKIYITKTTVWK